MPPAPPGPGGVGPTRAPGGALVGPAPPGTNLPVKMLDTGGCGVEVMSLCVCLILLFLSPLLFLPVVQSNLGPSGDRGEAARFGRSPKALGRRPSQEFPQPVMLVATFYVSFQL